MSEKAPTSGGASPADPLILDQPRVRAHSSVMIETDWRADITMASVAKHNQTTIQGFMRDSEAD